MQQLCPLCNNLVYQHNLCKTHYKKTRDEYNKILKENNSKYEIKEYYHNLRFTIYRLRGIEITRENLIKLIALAEVYFYLTKRDDLVKRCFSFAYTQMIRKYEIENNMSNEKKMIINHIQSDFDFRNKWPQKFSTSDGHYVRSLAEQTLANWFYMHNIMYSYEKKCILPQNPDIILIPDFYLKEYDLYIEYWGMYDEKYESRKNAKRELYKENNIKLLEITYNDIKHLDDYLLTELAKIKTTRKTSS